MLFKRNLFSGPTLFCLPLRWRDKIADSFVQNRNFEDFSQEWHSKDTLENKIL